MITSDRVRENTADVVNRRIDADAGRRLDRCRTLPDHVLWSRVRQLDAEWDIERVVETNASTLAFAGVVMAAVGRKRWLALPGVVLPLLFLHATQGWCPPVPLFRKLGVRTRTEIDEEKYAILDLLRERRGSGGGDCPGGGEASAESQAAV